MGRSADSCSVRAQSPRRRSKVPTRAPSSRLRRSALPLQNPLAPEASRVESAPASPGPVTSGALAVTTVTPRLAYELLLALDLDGDGRLTNRDAERARASGLRFALELQLAPGVRLELADAERLSHVADVLAEEI